MRLLSLLLIIASCKSQEAPKEKPKARDASAVVAVVDAAPPVDAVEVAPVLVPETAPARKIWIPRIDDAATFEAYSKQIGNERFAKFVIDLKTDAIYYFDVTVYPVHK